MIHHYYTVRYPTAIEKTSQMHHHIKVRRAITNILQEGGMQRGLMEKQRQRKHYSKKLTTCHSLWSHSSRKATKYLQNSTGENIDMEEDAPVDCLIYSDFIRTSSKIGNNSATSTMVVTASILVIPMEIAPKWLNWLNWTKKNYLNSRTESNKLISASLEDLLETQKYILREIFLKR